MSAFCFAILCVLASAAVSAMPIPEVEALPYDTLTMPPGFKIAAYADRASAGLIAPRELNVQSYDGAIITYVATLVANPNQIVALIDRDSDNVVDDSFVVYTTHENLAIFSLTVNPTTGQLYFAQPDHIHYCDGNANDLILHSFTAQSRLTCHEWFAAPYNNTWHSYHYMRFNTNDNTVCAAYGQPCNECIDKLLTPPKSTIQCYDSNVKNVNDINQGTIIATGVRNSYGYDWHPVTKQMWFTDNGRDDMLSVTNLPDDELNVVTKNGEFFGYPYCHSEGVGDPYLRDILSAWAIVDPMLGDGGFTKNCSTGFTLAKQPMGPHVAVLGARFYDESKYSMFPAQYKNALFMAQHGSWDRTPKIGYRISVVLFAPGTDTITDFQTFAQGWLNDTTQQVWGRVNDVNFLPDGSMLVADDQARTVYRITYDASEDTPEKQIQFEQKKLGLQAYWDKIEAKARAQELIGSMF